MALVCLTKNHLFVYRDILAKRSLILSYNEQFFSFSSINIFKNSNNCLEIPP